MTTRQAGGIALVLIVTAVFLFGVFGSVEAVQERHSLEQLRVLQEKPLQQAAQLRHRFESLVHGLTELAAQGDAGARLVVEELRRQGLALPAAKR